MNDLITKIKTRILYLKNLDEIDRILSSDKIDKIDLHNLYYGGLNDEIENLEDILKTLQKDYPEFIICVI
jgi:hypothetical protein